ncbi:flagellar biosynthesis protein FlhF [Paraburkholderia bonniea]|uniref:flagellar biosynthesis protein FlhF n=1 Tax=Paraburkholderia bonniea TaxID=2152891 RepID=UPI0025737A48|nr:flagellar biosynthesis protein FlhF [Paraburkholderia bonniea]WJF90420.1 flagellar biosynthesis protein FlhF [Paraburkholderia bonniea]WJF93735.1 flagellar biosynthesis protein FlhF [Paraburkholderia bonniea]
MNIRKFVGATSRDALRLVREALGADAVVLSNRTRDDGSVEIVALADSDLAALTPPAAARVTTSAAVAAGTATTATTTTTTTSTTPATVAAARPNPYASEMPDVFSSMFGASVEVSDEVASSGSTVPSQAPAPVAQRAPEQGSASHSAQPSRTQAETNFWRGEYSAASSAREGAQAVVTAQTSEPLPPTFGKSAASMSPADATRKGLGTPGPRVSATATTTVTAATTAAHATPAWAREAAQSAARRAAQHLAAEELRREPPPAVTATASTASTPPQGLHPNAAAAVSEAIKTRMEQVVNDTVMHELASMREMMETHFAGLQWAERQRRSPVHAALARQLFAAGFSAQLVRKLVDKLPAVDHQDAALAWVRSVLETNLPVMADEEALLERGGVFALMGPTGAGKTTTTAKLAARCVMRFGASKVALLTTDSYRIGGHEQLRIYGRILGVSVHAVKDTADLQLALAELRNKHIVLIDTIGMSQRDRLVSEQIAMLCNAGQRVQRLLLLNATSHGDTLNEVVQAYQSQSTGDSEPLAGCILTKLDEATHLGSALDTVMRYRLPVHYVSTGQKVPENLYVATSPFLIKSAFCIPREHSPFAPDDDDLPMLLSDPAARAGSGLHEVRFG